MEAGQRTFEARSTVSSHKRSVSVPRVEVKLQQKQKIANYRLEKLRQQREKEEMADLQVKPRICSKSRMLGERAERRFFGQFEMPLPEPIEPNEPIDNSPRITFSPIKKNQEREDVSFDFGSKFSVKSPPKQKPKRRAKSIHEPSIFYMSVLDRNTKWLEKKKEKIEEERRRKDEDEMKECTFAPVIFSRVPRVYQQYTPVQNRSISRHKESFIGSFSAWSSKFEPDATILTLGCEYQAISPYQVQVAYKAGCNLQNFTSNA